MAEYISRDKVLSFVYATHSTGGFKTEEDYLWLQEAVVDAATSDVQPVKHGRWEYFKNNGIFDTHKCTLCGENMKCTWILNRQLYTNTALTAAQKR